MDHPPVFNPSECRKGGGSVGMAMGAVLDFETVFSAQRLLNPIGNVSYRRLSSLALYELLETTTTTTKITRNEETLPMVLSPGICSLRENKLLRKDLRRQYLYWGVRSFEAGKNVDVTATDSNHYKLKSPACRHLLLRGCTHSSEAIIRFPNHTPHATAWNLQLHFLSKAEKLGSHPL